MHELTRLEDQLRRAMEGEAWHGPAVLELLEGVSAGQAAARPIAGAHTIWEIVLHLSATYRLVLRRLGGDATPLRAEEDWPPEPAPTPERWAEVVEGLRGLNSAVRTAVRGFAEDALDRPIVPELRTLRTRSSSA